MYGVWCRASRIQRPDAHGQWFWDLRVNNNKTIYLQVTRRFRGQRFAVSSWRRWACGRSVRAAVQTHPAPAAAAAAASWPTPTTWTPHPCTASPAYSSQNVNIACLQLPNVNIASLQFSKCKYSLFKVT